MRRSTELLTRDEVLRLMSKFSAKAPTGIRNRALIVLMWRAGLRIGEALSLLLRDIDVDRSTIHVRHGKGDIERRVPIDPGAMAIVMRWVDVRARLNIRAQIVICTLSGRPLAATYFRKAMREKAKSIGIEKRCHPHALRHLFASELDSERVPIAEISRLLGHARSSTTSLYIDHVGSQRLRDTIAGRPDWGSSSVLPPAPPPEPPPETLVSLSLPAPTPKVEHFDAEAVARVRARVRARRSQI